MLKIGCSIVKDKLIETLESYGGKQITAFQVFVSSPNNSYIGKDFTDNEIQRLNEWRTKKELYGVVHGKYIYNFCRQRCDHQVNQLVSELQLADKLGCDVIIHQGKNVIEEKLTRTEAINNYVEHVSRVLDETCELSNGILLENSAHQGNEIGYCLDELAYIYRQFEDHHKERLGFCLDLCHVFVAGELDVRDGDAVKNYIEEFEAQIGLEKLKCIHFNDSNVVYGGRHDFHGDIGCGYVSNPKLGGSIAGFREIAQMAYLKRIPIILETPCDLESSHISGQFLWQIEMIKGWAQGDNSSYKNYLVTHPQILDLAYESLTSKKTKKKQVSEKAIQPVACTCSQVTVTMPKIKIKLKSEKTL